MPSIAQPLFLGACKLWLGTLALSYQRPHHQNFGCDISSPPLQRDNGKRYNGDEQTENGNENRDVQKHERAMGSITLGRVDLFYYVDRQQTRDIVGLQ